MNDDVQIGRQLDQGASGRQEGWVSHQHVDSEPTQKNISKYERVLTNHPVFRSIYKNDITDDDEPLKMCDLGLTELSATQREAYDIALSHTNIFKPDDLSAYAQAMIFMIRL